MDVLEIRIFNHKPLLHNDWLFTKQINNFMSLVSSYNPGKHKKPKDYLMFSGSIERISGMNWINLMHPFSTP